MLSLLLLLTLSGQVCAKTIIINKTKVWSANDGKALKEASRRCGEKFESSPCLKTFIKYDTNRYSALCTSHKG